MIHTLQRKKLPSTSREPAVDLRSVDPWCRTEFCLQKKPGTQKREYKQHKRNEMVLFLFVVVSWVPNVDHLQRSVSFTLFCYLKVVQKSQFVARLFLC